MKKRILSMLFIIMLCSFLAACSEGNEPIKLPPKNGEEITLKTTSLLYQDSGSTAYSLGGVGSEFIFTEDKLSVKDGELVKTYIISYEKSTLTKNDFKRQLKNTDKIPDLSSFGNFTEYNLCESTSDSLGYRLYVVDDQYWLGTLYKKSIWRVVSLEIIQ